MRVLSIDVIKSNVIIYVFNPFSIVDCIVVLISVIVLRSIVVFIFTVDIDVLGIVGFDIVTFRI